MNALDVTIGLFVYWAGGAGCIDIDLPEWKTQFSI